MAAAAGGITRVACMPNTKPVIDSSIIVSGVKKRAEEEGYVHVEVIGAITKGEKGQEITEMGDMAMRGAMAFSDDGHYVGSAHIMLLAAKYAGIFDKALICHDIETELNHEGYMHEGACFRPPGGSWGTGHCRRHCRRPGCHHRGIYRHPRTHCPHRQQGRRGHCTPGQKKGIPITCEVAVHHLTLTDEMCSSYSTATRVSPPLRLGTMWKPCGKP